MKTVTANEIKGALKDAGLTGINTSMLSRCTTLVNTHHIQPKALADCWEAFSINKNIQDLADHTWQSFRNEVLKEADQRPSTTTSMDIEEKPHKGAVKVEPGMGKRQAGGAPSLVTPPTKKPNKGSGPDAVTSAVDAVVAASTYTPPKYEERTGAGKVVLTFNPNDLKPTPVATTATKQPPAITYQHFDTNVQKSYRHLFTPMEERAKALDEHLVRLEDILKERYHIGKDNNDDDDDAIAPLEGVGIPRQDKICCIGRICNAAHEGRINSTSVVLEGSRHLGGARIEMDLSHLKDSGDSFSLFPGQIVAVEGMNSTGRKLTAHRICEGAASGTRKSTAKQLLDYHHTSQNATPLKLMTVAGPYTTSDNLTYDPLYDFMSVVAQEKPDVVIMVGPFVDLRHKEIQSGSAFLQTEEDGAGLSLPFETLFTERIAAILGEFYEQDSDINTQFVLVPSLEDATAEWVYPQPPFQERVFGARGKVWDVTKDIELEIGTLGLEGIEKSKKARRRVHCVSNPCTLQINEIVIGVTGTDAIFHMSADETNGNLVPGSRLARISQHMLQQQSYYPLFPPAAGTNLDLKHMKQWNMPCQPDLLVVPSKLTSFARPVLGDTVVVNPGQLSKNTTGGTYGVMEIHPMKRDDLENAGGDDVELDHNIAERLRLEIRKI